MEDLRSWRPVIDLSILNLYVDVSHFRMETIQSVLLSVRQGDWMASIDLKEAYLQVPVHPDSRRFLRFVAQRSVYQFSAFCFSLSTAPQVFSRVMAPVSAILHSWGIRMRRYLDDWLVQSSSSESLLRDLSVVLDLCHERGIVVNLAKSHLVASQVVKYLGVVVDSQSFRASPSPERVARLRSTADAFLSCADPPASTWLSLLGMLSSLSHLVPGGRLRVRYLQLCLHRSWDRGDQSVRIPWTPDCLRDLQWWLDLPRLSHRVSPDLDFGPTPQTWVRELIWVLSPLRAFGMPIKLLCPSTLESFWPSGRVSSTSALLWSRRMWRYFATTPQQCHISTRRGHTVAVPQLPGSGNSPLDGVPLHPTVTPVHSGVPEHSGELSLSPSPAPSYRVVSSPGGFSVYQSHVAGPIRLICNIRKSPMLSLFLSLPGSGGSGHRRLPPTLGRASGLRVSSLVCNSSGSCEAQGVSGDGTHPDSSLLASASLVSRPPSPVAGPSGCSASPSRPPAPASVSRPLPGSPQASPSCLETKALHESCGILIHCSFSGFLVAGLPCLAPLSRAFCLPSDAV